MASTILIVAAAGAVKAEPVFASGPDADEHGIFRLDAAGPVDVASFSGGEIGG